MLVFFRQLLTLPQYQDDDSQRRARWLADVFLADITVVVIITLGGVLGNTLTPALVLGCLVCVIPLVALRLLLKHGHTQIIAFLRFLVLLAMLVGLLAFFGGVQKPLFSGYILLVGTAGLMMERRPATAAITLSVLVVTALLYAEDMHWLPPADYSITLAQWVTVVTFVVYTGLVTYRIQRGLTDALSQASQQLTRRKRTESKLQQVTNFLQGVMNSLDDPVIVKDEKHLYYVVNDAACRMLGHAREELANKGDADFFPPEVAARYAAQDDQVLASGRTTIFEEEILVNGSPRTIATKKSLYSEPSSGRRFVAAVIRDITERKKMEELLQRSRDELELQIADRTAELRASNISLQTEVLERQVVEAELRLSEERYALAARGANDGLWDLDLAGRKLYLSPRWKSLLGYGEGIESDPVAALASGNEFSLSQMRWWRSLIHPEDTRLVRTCFKAHINGSTPSFECEFRALHHDGVYRWMEMRGVAIRNVNGRAYRMAGSMTDITDRKRIEAQLIHDAFHDALTGLPNRSLLVDRLDQAIKAHKRHPEHGFAIIYTDLDRFKDINDSQGHSIGDQLLIAVVRRIEVCLRATDTLARQGGDEFVILLSDVNSIEEVLTVAERIQAQFKQPFDLHGVQVMTGMSAGIVMGNELYEYAEDILRDADIAMYRAKANGRAQYQVFDVSMHDEVLSRVRLESDLRRALERGELVVYYQPIRSILTGAFVGFETLARWQHPQRGLLQPAEFIPLAEESRLIIPLDRWVMDAACRQVNGWRSRFGIPINLSANLSSRQFAQADLIEQIQAILRATGFPAGSLHLEITESTIMENIELAALTLRQLQMLGVRMEIDDFGTGFSSLTYLFQLPVNTLKIDRSFIRSLVADRRKTEVVQTIINLAHNMGMKVVAEGLESAEQMEKLKLLGCDYGQGFLYSPPMDAAAAEAYLAANCGLPASIEPGLTASSSADR